MTTNTEALVGRAVVQAPGTCGELAQGMLEGKDFHITCPIDMYATATVEAFHGEGRVLGPADCPKAVRGAQLTLAHLARADVDVRLSLEGSLPRGKGMASSTADVAAAIGATALALGRSLSPDKIASLALQVEPSDGLMFPGIALFDHRRGLISKLLGPAPPLRVLVLDFGGTVDTMAFNTAQRTHPLSSLKGCWPRSVELISEGLRTQDVRLVGEGATMSTLAHGRVTPWPHLPAVISFARQINAVGVSAAHSGTVLGLLLPDDGPLARDAALRAWQHLPGLESLYSRRLVDGGLVPIQVGLGESVRQENVNQLSARRQATPLSKHYD